MEFSVNQLTKRLLRDIKYTFISLYKLCTTKTIIFFVTR